MNAVARAILCQSNSIYNWFFNDLFSLLSFVYVYGFACMSGLCLSDCYFNVKCINQNLSPDRKCVV